MSVTAADLSVIYPELVPPGWKFVAWSLKGQRFGAQMLHEALLAKDKPPIWSIADKPGWVHGDGVTLELAVRDAAERALRHPPDDLN